jgi:hypothetical protein
MAFFVSNKFLERQQDQVERLQARIDELTDEILRMRLKPVEVGGRVLVPTPDVPLHRDMQPGWSPPMELLRFAEEFGSEDVSSQIQAQAYEMHAMNISDEDIVRHILDNRATHEVV